MATRVATDYEFTVTARQTITHTWNSSTGYGHRDAVPNGKTEDVGGLDSTGIVCEAWERLSVPAAPEVRKAMSLVPRRRRQPDGGGCTCPDSCRPRSGRGRNARSVNPWASMPKAWLNRAR